MKSLNGQIIAQMMVQTNQLDVLLDFKFRQNKVLVITFSNEKLNGRNFLMTKVRNFQKLKLPIRLLIMN